MLQSCETLITKINLCQKAILELEKLSGEFLNSGDGRLKPEINKIKQEIEKFAKEYQELAYPELPNGQELFWPEEEALEELFGRHTLGLLDEDQIVIKKNHVSKFMSFVNPCPNLALFHKLELVFIFRPSFKQFPIFPKSIKEIKIVGSKYALDIPGDLTYLENLEIFVAPNLGMVRLPKFHSSIKELRIAENRFSTKEKKRIKKEYPNAKIEF